MGLLSIAELIRDDKEKVLVLDGGQGTEMEKRGLDISSKVWSTKPFLEEAFWDEDNDCFERKVIKEMFEDYALAGSDILTTLTYQTSFKTISENTNVASLKEYDQLLNRIVKFCRACVGNDKYLMGSIGTYAAYIGAEYHGDYGLYPASLDFLDYFSPQLHNFNMNTNIDLIGFETIPNKLELKALLSLDETAISKSFFISLSMNNDATLRDGTTTAEIGEMFRSRPVKNSNLLLMGINCCTYESSLCVLHQLRQELTEIPLIVYCNGGGTYDHSTQTWSVSTKKDLPRWDDLAQGFIANGARIIGGCCETTPSDVEAISNAVKKVTIDCSLLAHSRNARFNNFPHIQQK